MDAENKFLKTTKVARIIVPFIFKDSLETFEEKIKENGLWEPRGFATNRLHYHIKQLVRIKRSSDNPETIGTRYVLTNKGRAFSRIKTAKTPFDFLIKKEKLKICELYIPKVEMYLFETHVGFLVYTMCYNEKEDIKTIIDVNYYSKKLIGQESWFACKQNKVQNTDIEYLAEDCFNLSVVTANILGIFENVSFFEDNSKEKEDRKEEDKTRMSQALVFSMILLDKTYALEKEREHLLKEYLFRLRCSFRETYKPAPVEFDIKDNEEVIQLFENSYWGVSLEGIVNIVHLVEDDRTNSFFAGGNYVNQFMPTYFYIYILALHQRYALLYLALEASKISKSNSSSREILKMRKKIGDFLLRCLFRQVSNITHQEKLYQTILKTLGVEKLVEELQVEMEVLSSLAELEEQKIKEENTERENKFRDFLSIFLTIFVVIDATSSGFQIYDNISRNNYPQFGSSSFIICAVLMGALWVFILGSAIYYFLCIRGLWNRIKKRFLKNNI